MATLADAVLLVVYLAVFLLLPLGLMLLLAVLSRRYRGMFDQIGFSRKELGLLIIGSLSTLLIPSNVPLLLYKDYFLAVNVGGAIIPTVLSIHLLRAKELPWTQWLPGVAAVSAITFLITRVQPDAGIVAEFPYYFLPASAGAALALLLYSRHSPRAPAFAYATATLGSLIGADVFHLPELFQADSFTGSIGGASVFDLVYIGGIVSLALVLLFASSRLRALRAQVPEADLARQRVNAELRSAIAAILGGQYQLAAQRALGAVQERVGQLAPALGIGAPYPEALLQLARDPNVSQLYSVIARYANVGPLDFASARWTIQQAQYILDRLQTAERRRYASAGLRVGAFLFDAIIMGALLVAVFAALFAGGGSVASEPVLLYGALFWTYTIQVVYFTAFEYLWRGQTPGKRLFRIRVADLNDRPPDFITSFTRNTVRLLDFFLFGYLISVVLIQSGQRRQRLGDRVAETVVLPVPRRPPPPQPIYTQVG